MVSKKSTVLILVTIFLFFGLTLLEGRKFPESVRLVYQPRAGTSTTYKMEDSRLLSSRIELNLTSRIRSSAYREVREIEMKHKVEMALEEEARVE